MSVSPRPSYPRRIFVDSSANLALIDRADGNHATARRIAQRLIASHHRLFTTNFVVAESYTLLLNSLGRRIARTYLSEMRTSSFTIERIAPADEQRAEELLLYYNDKDCSYTDATSFAVMDRLGIAHAFTFDRSFEQYGKIALTL